MMNYRLPINRMHAWLMAIWMLASGAHAEIESRISSRFLARGERALLEVAVIGAKPNRFPEIAPVRGVQIRPAGGGPDTQLVPGRRIEHVFSYLVSSYEVGDHRIEPITVEIDGETLTTEALDFSVFNPDDLDWAKATAGDTTFRYASTFKVLNDQPFVGEAVPVEIKVFLPRDLFVVDWGIPDFERDGLTAWRMQPSKMKSEINLLGMPYTSVAYPTTLAPSRSGEVSIGPAKIRLISTKVVMDGLLKRIAVETNLEVPRKTLQVKPLPAGAPTGFSNAVGEFKIEVTTPTTEVNEGDPIPVDLVVRGTGNLDTLNPPQPLNSMGWKVYDTTRQQRGDERRKLSGSVSFKQFLRPLEIQPSLPTYRLVFFNPRTATYEVAESASIPLTMNPLTGGSTAPVGPPPSADTPVEKMADILGLIPNPALTRPAGNSFAQWWVHVLGGVLALALIAKALWMRHCHRFQKNPERSRKLLELREIESGTANDHEFLMAAGRFIERWLGKDESPEVRSIITERDTTCFSGSEPALTQLDAGRRKQILKILRQSLTSCLFLAACLFATLGTAQADEPARQAVEAYQQARYDKAIEAWLSSAPYEKLSADTLYHIGNACYRAGSPGHAALYYRRALARESNHHESLQNLRFIERKYGSLSVERPDYQYMLARLPLSSWQTITWAGIWLCVLAGLIFPATRQGARLRMFAILTLVCGPIIATCGGLGWRYFPNDAAFAALNDQAVIVNENVALHTEATRTSAQVIQAPPGSLCEIIHQSGKWTYVGFAAKTRGWIPASSIRKIIPESAPEPPQIRKPVADDSNA